MNGSSLYDYPELYDHIRTPDSETFDAVYNLITTTLGHAPRSIMDPACGPATWLAHFAGRGIKVAGNDIDPAMIESARSKCGKHIQELTVGDMCNLSFKTGPFDVSFELAGTCGLLSSEESFKKFLRNVKKHTRSKGLILLTLFFEEPQVSDRFPYLVGEWGPFSIVSGGKAWLRYEVLANHPLRNIDLVRRTVRVEGTDGNLDALVDEYEMYSWKVMHFWRVLEEFSDLHFCTAFRYDDPDGISIVEKEDFKGEINLVFRVE
ncbi:MAG TPA: class I SAM-dependent methyltransferase [Chitinispirillaceae bacterium]|nr:class I SAM-dependent methyltransferase [Chitinispirillaceae bacterium]